MFAGLLLTLVLARTAQAARTALDAKRDLLAVEADLGSADIRAARAHLMEARDRFATSRRQLATLGPVVAIARQIPLVRVQVRGMQAFVEAGEGLANAGIPIVEAAEKVIAPADRSVPIGSAVESLKAADASLRSGLRSLDGAMEKVRSLNGYRLFGPLGKARNDLLTRLPRIRARTDSVERGLAAFIAFAGGDGPRRYLIFSQNPDEVRPTGGFIGTFGVLAAGSGRLTLERYDDIETWTTAHPQAVVAPDQAGSPFPFLKPPVAQSLANVNNVPDWPRAARLAMSLWERGGEQPVDGALSISPAFLVRTLSVLGPVEVPGYDETVTAENALSRIEFYTHIAPIQGRTDPAGRKEFVAALAQVVFNRILAAPADRWRPLARAVGEAFDAREAMVWSRDAGVADEAARRHWDGKLPETFGDFFYDSEFEASAKNGRDLKRTYNHVVELRDDGSARITTTITIANTKPPSFYNKEAFSYITIYGPTGATLDPASDANAVPEPPIAGHPGNGWFRSAAPLGETKLTVVWEAPSVARRTAEGVLEYGLWWMRLPDHSGDVLNLQVHRPPGWHWEGKPPPGTFVLDRDLVGTWVLAQD